MAGSRWEIAEHLGLDPSNAGRDLKQLGRDGLINGQQEAGGRRTIRWFPANGASQSQPVSIYHSEPIEDAIFTPSPVSQSRALVPVGQAYDSRTAEVLARNAKPRRAQGGFKLDPRIAAALNHTFTTDGDEALSELATAINRNAEAVENQRRAGASKALTERSPEPPAPAPSMAEAIKAGLTLIAGGLQVHQRLAQQNAEARTAPTPQSVKTREPTDEELQQFVSELSDEELAELGLDEEELDAEPADEPNEEPVADFETFRSAKIEQRRQAESPSYGSGAFEESVDDKGHVAIRPTIRRDSFADLLDYTKFKKAEEAAKAAKAAKIEAARSAGRVRDFFTRTKVETGTKPEAQQPASQQTSVWSWLYRRVATPRQSIWK